jgi:hypothetical protein
MLELLSTYGSHGDIEPVVGLAVQMEVKKWDAPVATGVVSTGVWR